MSINAKAVTGAISKTRSFFKETRAEMKKVVWPSRQYVFVAAIVILFIVFLVGIFVMFADFTFAKLFTYLIKTF